MLTAVDGESKIRHQSNCWHIVGVRRLMLYHGIDLVCTVTIDAGSSAQHVQVNYGVRQRGACFTFQSIGDDFEHCSYVINYVVGLNDLTRVISYLSRIKIAYFTYLKPPRADDGRCTHESRGVRVALREPYVYLYWLLERDEQIEEDGVRY